MRGGGANSSPESTPPRGRELVRVAAAGRRWNVGTNADDEELIAHRRAVKAPLQGAHRARGLKLGAAASE